MKVRLLNVLTVCLVTLAVLSPGLVVFSLVWVRHTEFVKTQKIEFEANKINSANTTLFSATTNQNLEPTQVSTQLSDQNLVNQLLTAEQYKLAVLLQWFILLTPVFIGLGIIVYDRYLIYRAAVLKEQIEMLERLWQQSIEQ
ncbi:unknown protein [Nostoc sp. NIES-3756]|uniref:hypothetical protein n=1 Tax=Nostoc sp. NIES-3756 TaxID=1751286 RepID=UPI00071FBDC9|nr:hypothetical protein [Nostoc sp. NIES-3756]BAT55729.1 unknown protein [Nostoc sp. NIES-3756]BAY36509.1 hypothetical protein NIES2111_08360 [Nostoc sp. NIES-2111]